ncbi:hypothetical protein HETIRDRAFT_408703 [Heterobasidion irregulare TC 32-1]|uniref:Uncharacterized protein n=1 Tax=Heterobasidion irregulare (strain TC 32-1) TaxID=747525 RepID=W4KG22_HETIT|nr:uncharacterized protein HETIRDRAFT_408703 [Heterobasidion irregulare TC 32-1]ETW84788.1 hypothetical protein HETIRDRAFT_408703 [Heterobasidion irregulare TC 32-1]
MQSQYTPSAPVPNTGYPQQQIKQLGGAHAAPSHAAGMWPPPFGAVSPAPASAPAFAPALAPPIASTAPVSAISAPLLSTLANPPMSPATSINKPRSPDTDMDAYVGVGAACTPLDMTKRLLDETWATAVAAMQREANARQAWEAEKKKWGEERKRWEEERQGWGEEREWWREEREGWIEERYKMQQEKRRFERDGWGDAQKTWDEEKKRWQEERSLWSDEREEWEGEAEVLKESRRKALNGKKEAEQARDEAEQARAKAEEARRVAERERDDARDKYQALITVVQVERARGGMAAAGATDAVGIPTPDRVPPPTLFTTLPQNQGTTIAESDPSPSSFTSSTSSGFSVLALSPKQVGQRRVHEDEDEEMYLDEDKEYTKVENATL